MAARIEACHIAVGVRVRYIRETLGMPQGQLAERVGLERTSICNIEAGRQRVLLDTVERLATGLGVSPKHLLKGVWW